MIEQQKKILFLVPSTTASGGIKNYFSVLKDRLPLPNKYIIRGARNWPYRKGIIRELFRAWSDYNHFRKELRSGDFWLVQTSTSLGWFSILRDGIFMRMARKKRLKTIVFFRGWDKNVEHTIEKYFMFLFKFFFLKTDNIIVLSSSFKEKLIKWGYQNEIFIESTVVDNELIREFDLSEHRLKRFNDNNSREITILFLGRVEIPKGIYETIDAFIELTKRNPKYTIFLRIAGDGKERNKVQEYVDKNNLKNVVFLGHVEGEEKYMAFKNADIYLFPSYTEGMPNSLLEAMAFGLPVVSSPVGAIPEIIKSGENGFLTASKDPKVIADLVQKLIANKDLRQKISINNYRISHEKYTTSAVIKRLESIYLSLYNN